MQFNADLMMTHVLKRRFLSFPQLFDCSVKHVHVEIKSDAFYLSGLLVTEYFSGTAYFKILVGENKS